MLGGLTALEVQGQSNFQSDFYGAMKGKWTGTMEYLDFEDDSTTYTLESGLNCDTLSGMVMFTISFKEPDGSHFFDSGDITLTPDLQTLYFDGEWRVTNHSSGNGVLRLEVEQDGVDNMKDADIQQIIEVQSNKSLSIVKKVRYKDQGGQYFVRNTYLYYPSR